MEDIAIDRAMNRLNLTAIKISHGLNGEFQGRTRNSVFRIPGASLEFPVQSVANLNRSQVEAIHRAVNCDVFHLIWGPPGTGKTKVIPELEQGVSGPLLLVAVTN